MFKEGELVMYSGMGVCKVEKIGRPDFAEPDDDTQFYFLEPLYKSGIFYVPVKSRKASLRKVISKKEAKNLMENLDDVKWEIYSNPSIQKLSQHYQSIIDNHDCKELISLIKSIIEKEVEAQSKNKKLGQIDKRFRKKAEELVYGELAAVLNMDREKIESIISEGLQS